MELKKKPSTLKVVFLKYLLALGVAFFISLGVVALISDICMRIGFFTPANYTEDLARQAKPILEFKPEITEDMIPKGCKFAVFDENYKVKKTNLDSEDLAYATEYAKGNVNRNGSEKSYFFIEREDGYCVLQYYVQMRYHMEWLNQHFPKPEIFMFLSVFFCGLISIFIVSAIFANNLKKHLIPFMKATKKIKNQELDFEVERSSIKEFDNVLSSIYDMKEALKNSLKQKWDLEQTKKEQISALAHDVKTPLTIIKGNSELLKETSLNDEQKEYIYFIEKNSNQIEKYIGLLIDVSKAERGFSIQLEKVETRKFVDDVMEQLNSLAEKKQLKVKYEESSLLGEVTIDKDKLHRAIMNLIFNAVDYSPYNSDIYFFVICKDDFINFCIEDNGIGFSNEDLKSAKKQLYMGDCSRTLKKHHGMGLYIADSIAKQHGGILTLENSKKTGGAKVTIKIPL